MSIESAIGVVIKRAREAKGLSQEKLAEYSHVDRTYISVLERGLKSPTLKTLERIAAALGTLPEVLLADARSVAGEDSGKGKRRV